MMNIENFGNAIDTKIETFSRREDNNKRYYRRVFVPQTILVAFSPLLVAFSEKNEWIRIIAIACTCTVAALQAVSVYSDFKKNWISYKNTVNELEIIKLKYDNYKDCKDEKAKAALENLFNEFIDLIRAHEKLWASNVAGSKNKN